MTVRQIQRKLKARIKELRLQGHKADSITRMLNEEGFVTPRHGGPIKSGRVTYYARQMGVGWRNGAKSKVKQSRPKSMEVYEEKVKTIKKSNIIDQILASDLDKKAKLAILEHLL